MRILFKAYSDDIWIGAVYYVKNIVYQFLEYAKTDKNHQYEVFIYTPKDKADLFKFCSDYDNVHFIYAKERFWSKGESFLIRNLRELEWMLRVYGKRIDYIYPSYSPKSIYRKKSISWIPDFQHVFYPEFFSKAEREFRDSYFTEIAKNHSKLVLSSQDSYDIYCRLYPECKKNVGIVHFVSAIDENDINEDIKPILKKYNISDDNYFLVSNQFYRHKNHKCLIEAVRIAKEEKNTNIRVICTGLTQDSKDPKFFGEVVELINRYNLKENIRILGLIPRNEQLTLMKYAIAVVQPSLFEGWGTSTEDAKTLGKITVLSDIPVHREQADERTTFFKRESYYELCDKMSSLWEEYYNQPKIYGFKINKAFEYGQQFVKMINCYEDSYAE